MRIWLAAVVFLSLAPCARMAYAQSESLVPSSHDAYAQFVARAEDDDRDVDFKAMRLAYLQSDVRKKVKASAGVILGLRQQIKQALAKEDDKKVAELARQILSLEYVNLAALKYLRQSCGRMGDLKCAKHYHFVEFGLLKSILAGGDGRTCATAREVVTVDEEYFVVEMMELVVRRQVLVSEGGHSCDKLEVYGADGQEKALFFSIDKVLQDEAAR